MWELDCEESWAPKNWCFWTVVLEKTLESPLDYNEIQPVHPKRDQSWVFFGRNDAKAETPVFWPPHVKSWLIGKDSDAGRDWGQEEKGMTEDEMAGWHHWLDGCEFEWTPGDGDGQGGLVCCDSWGHRELDRTERLNWRLSWTNKKLLRYLLLFFFFSASLSHVQLFATPWTTAHCEILQVRILECVAFPFSRGSFQPRDQTWSPALQAYSSTFEPPGKPWWG